MKTTKNTALAIVPSTLLLGLTVAQTTDADLLHCSKWETCSSQLLANIA